MPRYEFGRRAGMSPAGIVGAPQDAEWGPVVPYPDAPGPDIQVVGPVRDGMRLIPSYAVIQSDSHGFAAKFKPHTGTQFEILGEIEVTSAIPNANVSLTLDVERQQGPGQHRVRIGIRRVDVQPEEVFFDSGNVNGPPGPGTITFFRNNIAIPAGLYTVTIEDGAELVHVEDGWVVVIEEQ